MLISGYEFWSLKATHGLPLDYLIEEFFSKDIYPKWDEVFLAAKKDGADIAKLVRSLKLYFEHICSSENKDYMIKAIDLLYDDMVKNGKI